MTSALLSFVIITSQAVAPKPGTNTPLAPTILVQKDEIKVYDSASLQNMLASMVGSLNSMLGGSNSVYSSSALVTALGNYQGVSSNSSMSQWQVLAQLPNWPAIGPQATTSTVYTANTGPAATGLIPGGTTTPPTVAATSTQTTTTPVTPTAPVTLSQFFGTNPAAPTPPTGPSTLGPSAQDLLQQQADLSYDIVNLALLLGGALSDQYVNLGYASDNTLVSRGQAVIGFPIYLEPTAADKDATAIVHVTLTPHYKAEGSGALKAEAALPDAQTNFLYKQAPTLRTANKLSQPISLEALYPREKTYNIAQITSKQTGFSAGALLSFLGVGYSNSGVKQSLFMVRDTDTLAVSEPSQPGNPSGSVAFRWEFHPVQSLGQHLVTAGTRQVFAQVALPTRRGATCFIDAKVRLEWTRPNGTPPASGCDPFTQLIEVPSFEPIVENSSIVAAPGVDSATVRLGGEFYQNSTAMALGATGVPSSQWLTFESEKEVRFTTTLENLMLFDPVFYGTTSEPKPYSLPLPDGPVSAAHPGHGHAVRNARALQHGANCEVTFELRPKFDPTMPGGPVVMLNGKVYGRGPNPIAYEDHGTYTTARFSALSTDVIGARALQVNTDYWGPRGAQIVPLDYPFVAPAPTVAFLGATDDNKKLVFLVSGANLNDRTSIETAGRTLAQGRDYEVLSDTTLKVSLSSLEVARNAQLLIRQKDDQEGFVGEPVAVILQNPMNAQAFALAPASTLPTASKLALTVSGPKLIGLSTISFNGTDYSSGQYSTPGKFQLAPDFSSAVFSTAIPSSPGTYPVILTFSDHSIYVLNFTVTKPS